MQRIASRNVWVHLSSGQRAAVIEEVLRILTEEVENERFREDPVESFESAGRGLLEAIEPQAGTRRRKTPAEPFPTRRARGKGDWLHLPERPKGCCAQMVPVPLSTTNWRPDPSVISRSSIRWISWPSLRNTFHPRGRI